MTVGNTNTNSVTMNSKDIIISNAGDAGNILAKVNITGLKYLWGTIPA